MNLWAGTALGLILAKLAVEWWLSWLNERHVQRHRDAVPEPYRDLISPDTYRQAVAYTCSKLRFGRLDDLWQTLVLCVALFSGVLPALHAGVTAHWGGSAAAMAGYLILCGVLLTLPDLPLDWYAQFRLEARFGFNTSTQRTWWLDKIKGLVLALALGFPLLWFILKLVEWTGAHWWLWGWGAVLGFQLLLTLLAPVLLLPLFNKFSPLPEGSLRDRLLDLARRTGFKARSIQVMDGSRRSRHSNAFFTGIGRFRKIVLFDTLIEQLSERELEAVLAHEIGHYKLRHVVKMLAGSAALLLAGFAACAGLAREAAFYEAFGFTPGGSLAPALLLFGLLGGVVSFWITPLFRFWSRRYEFQADAFAARVLQDPEPLIQALRKLAEKNLSNLTPHPLYSLVYYSHPTLWERERALRRLQNDARAERDTKAGAMGSAA